MEWEGWRGRGQSEMTLRIPLGTECDTVQSVSYTVAKERGGGVNP